MTTAPTLAAAAAGTALLVGLSRAAELAEERGVERGTIVAVLLGVAVVGTYLAVR